MRPTTWRKAYEVFNRAHKITHRTRAAQNIENSRTVDYLRQELARRMVERLSFIQRDFNSIVDLGAGAGHIEQEICADNEDARLVRSRIRGPITMVEGSNELLYRDIDLPFNHELQLDRIVADEEEWAGAPPNSVDAVLSNLSMHWINDLEGFLRRSEQMLKPDGLFLANMLAGDSLFELRTSLQLAEQERVGGVAPRLSPLANPSDVGNLMQRAGFKLVTLDAEEVIVGYPDMFALLEDLKMMGDSNAVTARPSTISRSLLQAANAIYREMHGEPDGMPATFRIMHMIGWKHADTQQQPMARGSAPRGFRTIPTSDIKPKGDGESANPSTTTSSKDSNGA